MISIKLDTLSHWRRKDTLGLEMRSLAGISFFLSHGVQIPEQGALADVVRTTSSEDGKPFNWNEIFEVFSLCTPRTSVLILQRWLVTIEESGFILTTAIFKLNTLLCCCANLHNFREVRRKPPATANLAGKMKVERKI
jgi:hypothetical protein